MAKYWILEIVWIAIFVICTWLFLAYADESSQLYSIVVGLLDILAILAIPVTAIIYMHQKANRP